MQNQARSLILIQLLSKQFQKAALYPFPFSILFEIKIYTIIFLAFVRFIFNVFNIILIKKEIIKN